MTPTVPCSWPPGAVKPSTRPAASHKGASGHTWYLPSLGGNSVFWFRTARTHISARALLYAEGYAEAWVIHGRLDGRSKAACR